ncbi:MAG: DUF2341 domain-containing protein [Candidatus Methanomethyliaceae archaeon]
MERGFALILTLLLLISLIPFEEARGWLSGWQYRRAITINNGGSAETAYTIFVNLTGYALNCAFNDCRDIRFTDANGNQLTFYTEKVAGKGAGQIKYFWVRIPSLPSGTTTIYAYYGNSGVSSASSKSAHYVYEDFESGTLGKFSTGSGASVDSSVKYEGSYAAKISDSVSSTGYYMTSSAGTFRFQDTPIRLVLYRYITATAGGATISTFTVSNSGKTNTRIYYLNSTHLYVYNASYVLPQNSWLRVEIIFYYSGGVYSYSVANQNFQTIFKSGNLSLSSLSPGFTSNDFLIYTATTFVGNVWSDMIFANKYSYMVSYTVGPETTANNPPTVSITSASPSSLYRGQYVTIQGTASDSDGYVTQVLVNITDPSGTRVVTNGLANGTTSWSYSWGSSFTSRLGSYSVSAVAVDNGSARSSVYTLNNAFTLLNNPPQITSYGSNITTVKVGGSALFYLNGTDLETPRSSLVAQITIRDPSNDIRVNRVSMSLNSGTNRWEYAYVLDETGTWQITFYLRDSDDAEVSQDHQVQCVTISVLSLSVVPNETTRPSSVTLNASVSGDLDTLTVRYRVYDPEDHLFSEGTMSYSKSVSGVHYFTHSLGLGTGALAGYYDVIINATDVNGGDEKAFLQAFRVLNVDPLIHSITLNTASIERGKTLSIRVNATDPEGSGLLVYIRIYSPQNESIYFAYCSYNSSSGLYEASWTTSAATQLGNYKVEASAEDVEGGLASLSRDFLVVNSRPVIHEVLTSSEEVYVNSTVWIYANVSDYETQVHLLVVAVKIDNHQGLMSFDSSSNLFKYAYVPTSAKTYDVQVNATDLDGDTTSLTRNGLFRAYLPTGGSEGGEVTETTTTSISLWNLPNGTMKDWLKDLFSRIPVISDIQEVLGTVETLVGIIAGIFFIYAVRGGKQGKVRRR